jgi:CBS domain containing-hemolysin-like protein
MTLKRGSFKFLERFINRRRARLHLTPDPDPQFSDPGPPDKIELPTEDQNASPTGSMPVAHTIDFGSLVVRQISIPRTEVVAVEASESVAGAVRLCLDRNITKLPVYEDTLDQVVGIVHLPDLVRALQDGPGEDHSVRDLAREALHVPETIPVNELLRQFRDRRTHIAIVLDEYGGTFGLVTLEDLLEELVGEVQGPFDAPQPEVQVLADGSARVDGKATIDTVNEQLGTHLEDPNYDTIAGFVLGRLGCIPREGEIIKVDEAGILIRVEKMDHLRIASLHIQPIQD